MEIDILTKVAGDIKGINTTISQARILIDCLKDAGEDVTEMESNLRNLEKRKARWESMLEGRGYAV